MIRLRRLHFSLALTVLAVVCFALRANVAAGTSASVSGQGRHLGQQKKPHGDERERREQGQAKRHHGHQFQAREREISGYYANPARGLPPGLANRTDVHD
jgi:hypothetical protein